MLLIQLLLKLGQGHSDPKMVCDTPPYQDAYTYQIWNPFLKEYKRYARNTIILKTRNPFLKEYKRLAWNTIILKTRSEVEVTVTQNRM